jgi:hypothetical protein
LRSLQDLRHQSAGSRYQLADSAGRRRTKICTHLIKEARLVGRKQSCTVVKAAMYISVAQPRTCPIRGCCISPEQGSSSSLILLRKVNQHNHSIGSFTYATPIRPSNTTFSFQRAFITGLGDRHRVGHVPLVCAEAWQPPSRSFHLVNLPILDLRRHSINITTTAPITICFHLREYLRRKTPLIKCRFTALFRQPGASPGLRA